MDVIQLAPGGVDLGPGPGRCLYAQAVTEGPLRLGQATAQHWQHRHGTLGIRVRLEPGVDREAMTFLVRAMLEAAGPQFSRAILYLVEPGFLGVMEKEGWRPLEEVTLYARDPGPLDPVVPSGLVRPFCSGDLPALLEVDGRAFDAVWWKSPRDFLSVASEPGWNLLVGELEGQIAGFCSAYWLPGRSGYIGRLGVDPGHQRRGLGNWLLQRALTGLTYCRVELNTPSRNTAARRLYEKAGFRAQGQRWFMEKQW